MKAAIASMRKELEGFFGKEETENLIFLIFEKLKGLSRTQFLLSREMVLTEVERVAIATIVERLLKHEPIQYIFGETEFYGLRFLTEPGTLIPRPETEELVQWMIQENGQQSPVILDIGTGTGCIAIALSKNLENARVLACDISPVCLDLAKRNAELNKTAVDVFGYDVLNNSPEIAWPELDIIVSNPPYVRKSEKKLMEKNVLLYEPDLALFVPDENPLLFYEKIAYMALVRLKPGGSLYFEINEAFGKECSAMLQQKGFKNLVQKKDINGKDRFIRAKA